MEATLLLLAVVGGYAFSVIFKPSNYQSARESGHRLYFRAVFYAAFLVLCSTEIYIYLYSKGWLAGVLPQTNDVDNLQSSMPVIHGILLNDHAQTTILLMSFILGPILASVLNLFISGKADKKLVEYTIRNNDFEKLVFRAAYSEIPLMLSLKSGQLYVGWIIKGPTPSATRRAIRILPLLSGYRGPTQKRVQFTTSYYDILNAVKNENGSLDHLVPEDFEVVLPASEITSAHLFDLEAYDHFYDP